MNRVEIANLILNKINESRNDIKQKYFSSSSTIGHFYIDDLLPDDVAIEIYKAFPSKEEMKLKKSLREFKYIAAQMDQYNPLLEEIVFAFQDSRIVNLIQEICMIESLYPDEHLYAGGISLMGKNQYLNPHLDNSHEKNRDRWRVLNLLYYVTPAWQPEFGGNLELWPEGVKKNPVTIDSLFNRLVVMVTHGSSWHSVSPIVVDQKRTCVSNYYFSDTPIKADDRFHVTSFRGRPEQRIRDTVLQADKVIRQGVRQLFPNGVIKTDHIYKKRK